MEYSYEELYFEHGQYDRFVLIELRYDSECEKLLRENPPKDSIMPSYQLMGTFRFSNAEVNELEKLRDVKPLPRTERRVRFFPSELHKFPEKVTTFLDRDGVLCSDIGRVWKRDVPLENRYTKEGIKERPGVIEIKINPNPKFDVHLAELKLHCQWTSAGVTFPKFQWNKFYALAHYFNAKGEDIIKNVYQDYEKGILNPEIRTEYLKIKQERNELNESEKQELLDLLRPVHAVRAEVLMAELQRSTHSIKDLYKDYPEQVKALPYLTTYFEDEILLHGKPSIWWDIDRYLHIYLRHVKEFQLGSNFTKKGVFQYHLKDIKHVIKDVIEIVRKEIDEHFKTNPDKLFFRKHDRAINYDGNFYRLDIEPTGRLLTFHPYRTLKEAAADTDDD